MDKIHITYHTTIVKIVKEILLKNADMESIMWSERGEVSQQGESWKNGRDELLDVVIRSGAPFKRILGFRSGAGSSIPVY